MIRRTEENSDMIGSGAALLRAVRRACEKAKMHGLPIAISHHGKVIEVAPEDIMAELDTRERKTCVPTV